MTLPKKLDLNAPQEWNSAPMPGANMPISLVRLESREDKFTIHAAFPRGFERTVTGGYAASEEILVLDGELELEGLLYRRGDLVVVPAAYPRTSVCSPVGCRVLAWFDGPPNFVSVGEMPTCVETIASASTFRADDLPNSQAATWNRGPVPIGANEVEIVSSALSVWRRSAADRPDLDDLVRVERQE